MKVRRKADPPRGEYEVKTETDHSYLTVDGYELNKDYYEPVETEPRWQDVTGECEVDEWGGLYLAKSMNIIYGKSQIGYRLRKVRIYSPYESDPKDAFIVERKAE